MPSPRPITARGEDEGQENLMKRSLASVICVSSTGHSRPLGACAPFKSLEPAITQPDAASSELSFKILNSFMNVDPTKLFVMDDSTRTRNNGAKLKCRQVHSDYTKLFFTNAVVRDWNRLPPSVVQCSSIASFTNNLHRYLLHLNVH